MGVTPASCALLSAYARSLIRIKAKEICTKPGFSRSDREDLAQEITLHLLEKSDRYDPSRASPDTFANRVIESQAKMILRARRRLKRGARAKIQSLEEKHLDASRRLVPLAHVIDAAAGCRRLAATAQDPITFVDNADAVNRVLTALPTEVRAIAERLRHTTVAAIANEMGMSRRQVYAAVARIRGQCELHGLGEL